MEWNDTKEMSWMGGDHLGDTNFGRRLIGKADKIPYEYQGLNILVIISNTCPKEKGIL
ncbi:MAG: hypothetical protein PVG84_21560 [Desulfobacterales bacterium]|jgi:hypothetical protein